MVEDMGGRLFADALPGARFSGADLMTLRIVSWLRQPKHLGEDARPGTITIAALVERGYDVEDIARLYPDEPIEDYLVDVELVSLRRIDPRLSTLDDRAHVIALHQPGFPGMVTNNYRMLKNPRELAAIIETKLTIFAIEGVGG